MEGWEITLNFGERIPGKELLILLQKIDQTGSLNRAVEEAGISYRYGWGLLNRAEKTLGKNLVIRQTGGSSGGGTTLTSEGRKLLGYMQSLQREVQGQLSSVLNEKMPENSRQIMLASTMEPVVTGLLDVLEQAFLNETGITVRHVATGSGQALNMAKAGRADVVLTHAPKQEEEFMLDGWGVFRFDVMNNDFILVGPYRDPADAENAGTIAEAFERIASAQARFISRGDLSGTHLHEMMIWEMAGIDPDEFPWHIKANSMLGNYGVLRKAADEAGYTLVDRASYITGHAGDDLKILYCGTRELQSRISVIPVNRAKAAVNQNLAEEFARWLVSGRAKELIAEFGKQQYGSPLFMPSNT